MDDAKNEEELTPWSELTKLRKKVIEVIYKSGGRIGLREIKRYIRTTNSLLHQINVENGYIKWDGRAAGYPVLIAVYEDGMVDYIAERDEQETVFQDHAEELAKRTETNKLTYNDWMRERDRVCKDFNSRIKKMGIKGFPRLYPSWGRYYWDITPRAMPMLKSIYGERPPPLE